MCPFLFSSEESEALNRSTLPVGRSGACLSPSIYERAVLAGDGACDNGQGATLTPWSNVKWPGKQPC